MAQSCCFIVQIAVASVKGRCWIGCNGKSNWTKTGIGSKFICDLVLLLHFAFTSLFPMYTSFRKTVLWCHPILFHHQGFPPKLSKINTGLSGPNKSEFICLQHRSKKSMQNLKMVHIAFRRLFTGNTNHIYFGDVILCAHPS